MGRLRKLGLWGLAAVTLIAWIPYATCSGSAPKTAIKIVKPSAQTPSQEKLPAASKRQQQMVPLSVEDDENFSGQRPTFAPFPPGFTQGAPPRYFDGVGVDAPSDRYDIEEAPSDRDNNGMGFMPEFGPPKGFPDLSKLTGGEFGKMEAPAANVGSYERVPQYSSYPRVGGVSSKFRPFAQFSPQGDYDESLDGPNEGAFGAGPSPSPSPQPQGAPKRRPYRSGRPSFGGGRPGAFGLGGGPSGPGPYGAPEGIGGPGPYGAPDGLRGGGPGPYGGGGPGLNGPSRPFGGRPSRPSGLFGGSSDGPSSRPGLFGNGPEGPPQRPGLFSSDGPSSRPGLFGSDGPPSRPGLFGSSSDGPSEGPGPFGPGGSSDGPSGRPGPFGPGGSSDGPSGRPGPFGPGGNSDEARPLFGGSSSDGPSSRPGGPFGLDGPPSGGPYDSADGPSRPGVSFLSLDGPSRSPFGGPSGGRPGSFGGPPNRPGPYGAPGGNGPESDGPGSGPGPFGGSGRHETPAFSFQNSGGSPGGPGFRLSRGYPRYHPNQIQNDDFKESADNGDFTPYNGPPSRFNYPPRQQANFGPGGPSGPSGPGGPSGPDDYEQGPPRYEGPRSRRPEFSAPHHRQLQPPHGYGSTHRYDSSPKRPYVLKAKDKRSHHLKEDASARAKSYLVKNRSKRDLEEVHLNGTAQASSTPCKTNKERGCRALSSTRSNKKHISRRGSAATPRTRNNSVGRNATRPVRSRLVAQDPMIADGTQQTGFWDVSPGFGTYNTFKKQSANRHTHHGQDRHDEYEEEEEDEAVAPPPSPARSSTARKNQTTYLDTTSDEQRFFPSFPAPPSPYLNPFSSGAGFARPPLFPGPTANRAPSRFHPQFGPKYTQPHTNRGPGSAYPAESHDRYLHTNLLGSGNFEVVRGGTYYGDDDDGYHHTTGGSGPQHYHQEDDDGYFHHNSHSSPYRNSANSGGGGGGGSGGGDFFANFRDFADINPPTRSFSHHHETVADTELHESASHEQPKNILDKLESSSDKIEVHQPYTASSSSSSSSSSRDNDPMMATF